MTDDDGGRGGRGGGGPEQPRASVRVAAYNLRDLKDDLPAAVRVIRTIAPDVLCLQEVPRHRFSGHRVADLAARCGMYWTGGHRGAGGTTILTSLRLQLLDGSHQRLRVPVLQRPRGYAVARVALPGRPPLTAVSVHLSLRPAERQVHVGAVLRALPDGPVVVAGDLNEPAGGSAWAALCGRLRPVTPDAPTFPARAPRRRLDAVFATADLVVTRRRPAPVPDPADLRAASDHLPVWVDLV